MRNKKGFTLVELLGVIALLAILMSIAVPNVISTINNNKRNTFLADAKRMVSKANYLISADRVERDKVKSGIPKVYMLSDLNEKEEFANDPDGGSYNTSTYVRVSYDTVNKAYKYCICVMGSKRRISNANTCNPVSTTDCLDSSSLTGISVIKDN